MRSGPGQGKGVTLDPAFETSSAPVGDLPLCHVRLQADARWPWLILIPRAPGAREVEDLSPGDRLRLIDEAVAAGGAVRALGRALALPVDKLNWGALGNVTPQLHLHVVGRRVGDPAWPGPVWGAGTPEAYEAEVLAYARTVAAGALGLEG